jgi:hypothetical protein
MLDEPLISPGGDCRRKLAAAWMRSVASITIDVEDRVPVAAVASDVSLMANVHSGCNSDQRKIISCNYRPSHNLVYYEYTTGNKIK